MECASGMCAPSERGHTPPKATTSSRRTVSGQHGHSDEVAHEQDHEQSLRNHAAQTVQAKVGQSTDRAGVRTAGDFVERRAPSDFAHPRRHRTGSRRVTRRVQGD